MPCDECARLRERIAELERQVSASSKQVEPANGHTFDFSKHSKRKIALKFCYDGSQYCGLAIQNGKTPLPTVEEKLLDALEQAKLIPTRELEVIGFSRCGRTDRGVSAAGQVVSLWIRSALPQSEAGQIAGPSGDDAYERAKEAKAPLDPTEGELAYDHLLNRILPPSIRILAWSPVDAAFDARFSCVGRHYKYFFSSMPHAPLDVDAMRDAAARLVGEHDFRNFCKLDGSKQIVNYKRTVTAARISEARDTGIEGLFVLDLEGNAFLWHQVRHIMAILFHVGSGLEKPHVVDDLLNVANVESKPAYEMAEALPLVLWDCIFGEESVRWISSSAQTASTLAALAEEARIEAALPRTHLSAYEQLVQLSPERAKGGDLQRGGGVGAAATSKYRPLLSRERGMHFEEVNKRWNEGKGARRQANKET